MLTVARCKLPVTFVPLMAPNPGDDTGPSEIMLLDTIAKAYKQRQVVLVV